MRSRAANTLFSRSCSGPWFSDAPRTRKPSAVAPEREALLRVVDDDGRVIDAEEQRLVRLPAGVAFARGKFQDLKKVAVRVAKVEGRDTAGVRVPIGQDLGPHGRVLDPVIPQMLISCVHLADDDGDVLEPEIVASGVGRVGAAFGGQEVDQLDFFLAQAQAGDLRSRAENAEETGRAPRRKPPFARQARRAGPRCRSRATGPGR